MRHKLDEMCHNYHSQDPAQSVSMKKINPKGLDLTETEREELITNEYESQYEKVLKDIHWIKDILYNFWCLLCCYFPSEINGINKNVVTNEAESNMAEMLLESHVLELCVIIHDITLPLLQEYLTHLKMKLKITKNTKSLHSSIIVSFRLCLTIAFDSIIRNPYFKPLFDSLNEKNSNDSELQNSEKMMQQHESATKLCEILNQFPTIGNNERLDINARGYVEIGSFSRKFFKTFPLFQELIDNLVTNKLIIINDIQYIHHLVKISIDKNDDEIEVSTNSNKKQNKTTDDLNESEQEKIVQMIELFPDRSDAYCTEVLSYFQWNLDVAITHVMDGTVPAAIEAIMESNNGNSNNNIILSTSSKKSKKQRKKDKKQKEIESKEKEQAEFEAFLKQTGRVAKNTKVETSKEKKKKKTKVGKWKKDPFHKSETIRTEDDYDEEDIMALFGFTEIKKDKKLKNYQKQLLVNYNEYEDEYDDGFELYRQGSYTVNDGEALDNNNNKKNDANNREMKEEKQSKVAIKSKQQTKEPKSKVSSKTMKTTENNTNNTNNMNNDTNDANISNDNDINSKEANYYNFIEYKPTFEEQMAINEANEERRKEEQAKDAEKQRKDKYNKRQRQQQYQYAKKYGKNSKKEKQRQREENSGDFSIHRPSQQRSPQQEQNERYFEGEQESNRRPQTAPQQHQRNDERNMERQNDRYDSNYDGNNGYNDNRRNYNDYRNDNRNYNDNYNRNDSYNDNYNDNYRSYNNRNNRNDRNDRNESNYSYNNNNRNNYQRGGGRGRGGRGGGGRGRGSRGRGRGGARSNQRYQKEKRREQANRKYARVNR